MKTNPTLTATAHAHYHPRKERIGYKLMQGGVTLLTHTAPSFLKWYAKQHNLKNTLILGIYE